MPKRPQTALAGLFVRMREPLRKQLEVAAKKRGVSLNAELVSRLERSFQIDSVEEIVEAQRAEIKRWAEMWERSEKLLEESDNRWAAMEERVATLETWSDIADEESTQRAESENAHERQHHSTRKKG